MHKLVKVAAAAGLLASIWGCGSGKSQSVIKPPEGPLPPNLVEEKPEIKAIEVADHSPVVKPRDPGNPLTIDPK